VRYLNVYFSSDYHEHAQNGDLIINVLLPNRVTLKWLLDFCYGGGLHAFH
jgi:hypothetical protein